MTFTDEDYQRELAELRQMDDELKEIVAAEQESIANVEANHQLAAEMLADDYREEAAEIQARLDRLAGEKEADAQEEARRSKAPNLLPWRKRA